MGLSHPRHVEGFIRCIRTQKFVLFINFKVLRGFLGDWKYSKTPEEAAVTTSGATA